MGIDIAPGQIYEDGFFHPCICVDIDCGVDDADLPLTVRCCTPVRGCRPGSGIGDGGREAAAAVCALEGVASGRGCGMIAGVVVGVGGTISRCK